MNTINTGVEIRSVSEATPGLESKRPAFWRRITSIDALPLDGTFVVNVGGLLERWTNGLYAVR